MALHPHLRRALIASGAVLTLALTACSVGGNGDDDVTEDFEPVTLTYADFNAPQGPIADAMAAWQGHITEQTGGAVTFENYYSASLLGTADMLSGVQGGVADLGLIFPTYYPQDLPVTSWLQAMNAYSSMSPVRAIGVGSAAASEISLSEGPVLDEFRSIGLEPGMMVGTAAYNLTCTAPIESLDETTGKRVRTSGPVWSQAVQALKMTVVDLPYNDMYEGMQRGIIDCAAISAIAIDTAGFGEVGPYVSPVALPQITSFWTWNKDRWDSLDPEVRQIIHDASSIFIESLIGSYLGGTQAAFESFTADGSPVVLQDASKLQPLIDKARDAYIDGLADSAPSSLTDAEDLLDRYRAALEAWDERMTELGYAAAPASIDEVLEETATLSAVDLGPYIKALVTDVLAKVKH